MSKIALASLLLIACSLRAESVVLFAGGGTGPDGGPAIGAKIKIPFAVGFDKVGNAYIPEFGGDHVRKVDTKGVITTISGNGTKGHTGDGGPASAGTVNWMHNLVVGPDGNIYIADTGNFCVRKIDLGTGIISTLAGTGKKGFSGDGGPATQAMFGGVFCVAFDAKGEHLYALDLDNKRVRSIDMKTGIVTTIAGNGKNGVPANGSDAASSPLADPRAVAADSKGNVYILERGGNALRVVDTAGKIHAVAGTGKSGFSGDGGDALKAELAGPKHIYCDHDDNVLIADTNNHSVRKYTPKDGKINRIAGTGKSGSAGLNGPPEQLQLSQPHGVYVDAAGTLFITDSYNDRILKIVK
ncbi:MAG: hypothetical protein WCT04_04940 [Planctomycetota bacterium]